MSHQHILWQQDGVDPGWFTAEHVGSIRNSKSYLPGGWLFLPSWLPDTQEHDVGPFKTKAAALVEAERMAALHKRKRRDPLRLGHVCSEQRLHFTEG